MEPPPSNAGIKQAKLKISDTCKDKGEIEQGAFCARSESFKVNVERSQLHCENQYCVACQDEVLSNPTLSPLEEVGEVTYHDNRALKLEWGLQIADMWGLIHLNAGIRRPRPMAGHDSVVNNLVPRYTAERDEARGRLDEWHKSHALGNLFPHSSFMELLNHYDKRKESIVQKLKTESCSVLTGGYLFEVGPGYIHVNFDSVKVEYLNPILTNSRRNGASDAMAPLARYVYLSHALLNIPDKTDIKEFIEGPWLLKTYFERRGSKTMPQEEIAAQTERFWMFLDYECLWGTLYWISRLDVDNDNPPYRLRRGLEGLMRLDSIYKSHPPLCKDDRQSMRPFGKRFRLCSRVPFSMTAWLIEFSGENR